METKIQEINELQERLNKYYEGKYTQGSYSEDGLVDPVEYFKTDERILWILKETNTMGGYDMKETENWGDKTFRKLVFTSYGILNKKSHNSDWDFEDIKSKIGSKIGYINIKKAEGVGTSINNELQEAYQQDKDFILEQVKVYEPTIIIFGNTFQFMEGDFVHIKNEDYQKTWTVPNLGIHITPKLLLLDAYHPAYHYKISDELYVNSIVEAYSNWRKLYPQKQS